MKVRSFVVGAAVLAAVAMTPAKASAQAAGCLTPTVSQTLGIGGFLSGCFSFALSELGENAGYVSTQYYWAGNFGSSSGSGPSNAPTPTGTQFFNDDCGSNGANHFTFAFCNTPSLIASHTAGPIANTAGELVFGLLVPDLTNNAGQPYWVYSGGQGVLPLGNRNGYPAPNGFQAVLYQLSTGGSNASQLAANAIAGEYLLAWEDINTGCTSVNPSSTAFSTQYFDVANLTNGLFLDDPNGCTTVPGGPADADYNDSYFRISITGGTLQVVPEPMTMTLMATGLVGLAGAQMRRRRKSKN